MRVTVQDMRAITGRPCAKGSRRFCEDHGISWDRFVTEGIPIEEIEHIDDYVLKQVIEVARARNAG